MSVVRSLRPSPALCVALLALVVSLSGVAYAAATIGAADIKNSAVRTRHLAADSVTTPKIRAGAVRSKALADGTVGLNDLAPGAQPHVAGYEVVLQGNTFLAADTDESFSAQCPEGKVAIGGGVSFFNNKFQLMSSTPLEGQPRVWFVTVRTLDGSTAGVNSAVNIRVVCAFAD